VCGKNVPHYYEQTIPAGYRALKFGEIRVKGDKWFSVVTGWEHVNVEDDTYLPHCNLSVRPVAPTVTTFTAHYAVNDTLYRTEAEALSAATEAARGSVGPVIVYRAVKQVSVELEEKITIKEAR